jgi:hypothetical protein
MVAPIGKDHWLTQLLLKQQPDLVHTDYGIVVVPIGHFRREMIIYDFPDQTGMGGAWDVLGLWSPDRPSVLEDFIGVGIPFHKDGPVTVMGVVPPMPYDLFREQVEVNVLPYLRSINSMERLYSEYNRTRKRLLSDSPDQHFQLALATGNLGEALKLLSRHRAEWFRDPVDYFDEDSVENTRQLCRLLEANNYAGLARVFHGWEERIVANSEMTAVWQPAPFPFEPGYEDWKRSAVKPRG